MAFYPGNPPRAGRLEQLVNSMIGMQTDIQDYADRMDKQDKKMRPALDKLLAEQGISNVGDLIQKSTAQFSPDDQHRFREVIDAVKHGGILDLGDLFGAGQKTKLIEAIHHAQPARLCIAFLKQRAMNILEQSNFMQFYLDALDGSSIDEDAAAYLAKKIVNNIKAADLAINWEDLEHKLEEQDKAAGNYYDEDDLPFDQVIAAAKASNAS